MKKSSLNMYGALIILIAISLIGAIILWKSRASDLVQNPRNNDDQAQVEVLDTLSQYNGAPSLQDKKDVTSVLSNSKTTTTEQDRQRILNQLTK